MRNHTVSVNQRRQSSRDFKSLWGSRCCVHAQFCAWMLLLLLYRPNFKSSVSTLIFSSPALRTRKKDSLFATPNPLLRFSLSAVLPQLFLIMYSSIAYSLSLSWHSDTKHSLHIVLGLEKTCICSIAAIYPAPSQTVVLHCKVLAQWGECSRHTGQADREKAATGNVRFPLLLSQKNWKANSNWTSVIRTDPDCYVECKMRKRRQGRAKTKQGQMTCV